MGDAWNQGVDIVARLLVWCSKTRPLYRVAPEIPQTITLHDKTTCRLRTNRIRRRHHNPRRGRGISSWLSVLLVGGTHSGFLSDGHSAFSAPGRVRPTLVRRCPASYGSCCSAHEGTPGVNDDEARVLSFAVGDAHLDIQRRMAGRGEQHEC